MSNLFIIWYIDTIGNRVYEDTTDNFEKWLEDHNKSRISDGEEPELEDDFQTQQICPKLFNNIIKRKETKT